MSPSTLIVGLGNPILGDDGVGWRVVEQVRALADHSDVAVLCLSLGGLALMEHLVGYRRVMIVDAMTTGAPAGTLHRLDALDMDELHVQHTASVHDLSLSSALAMGRELGLDLPAEIRVVGVEAAPEFEFGEVLSELVDRAIPAATRVVLDWMGHDPGAPR
jgi:hydrogenase maturation protease